MKKYIAIIVIVVVIILLFMGVTQFSEFNKKEETIKVGQAVFSLPEGYEPGTTDSLGGNTINNGTNRISIKERNENITQCLDDYIDYHNGSVYVENILIDGNNISKTTRYNDTNTHHYFVEKNHKVYDFYATDGNKNMDSTIINMIISG